MIRLQGLVKHQDEYNAQYDEMVSRYEATSAERDRVGSEIHQCDIRRQEFDRFITTLEGLWGTVTEYDEALWGSIVEYVMAYGKDNLRFMLSC